MNRPNRFALLLLSFLVLGGMVFSVSVDSAQAADSPSVVITYDLMPGYSAQIMSDGTLVFLAEGVPDPLLRAQVPAQGDLRRIRQRDSQMKIFTETLSEGVQGGRRGFSSGADDDGDGRVDEDRLDGQDNDGDGLIDEDFAAISDEMSIVNRIEGRYFVHQESYHWSYPNLKSTVFLSLASDRTDLVAWDVNALNGCWVETDFSAPRHSATGRSSNLVGHAFVTQVEIPGQTRSLWLAVMVPGDHPGYLALGDDGGCRLEFPLAENPLPLVVTMAQTWGQLKSRLVEADLVYRGVSDPLKNNVAHWIVPANCGKCRVAELPEFNFHFDSNEKLVLTMDVEAGQCIQFDPELFRLQDQPLGAPSSIVWQPVSGVRQSMDWSLVSAADLRLIAPSQEHPLVVFGLTEGHDFSGRFEYHFDSGPGNRDLVAAPLSGVSLDGRPFEVRINKSVFADGAMDATTVQGVMVPGGPVLSSPISSPEDTREVLNSDLRPPTLSPQLLEGWPNPFRDAIQIKFKVPATVGEAFVWEDHLEGQPAVDKQAQVPWGGGMPSASIKIYNINGQELVTLHDGNVNQGEYTVHWNGTDLFGRRVASGTYFCKLQLDEWSVTRRIVYIR